MRKKKKMGDIPYDIIRYTIAPYLTTSYILEVRLTCHALNDALIDRLVTDRPSAEKYGNSWVVSDGGSIHHRDAIADRVICLPKMVRDAYSWRMRVSRQDDVADRRDRFTRILNAAKAVNLRIVHITFGSRISGILAPPCPDDINIYMEMNYLVNTPDHVWMRLGGEDVLAEYLEDIDASTVIHNIYSHGIIINADDKYMGQDGAATNEIYRVLYRTDGWPKVDEHLYCQTYTCPDGREVYMYDMASRDDLHRMVMTPRDPDMHYRSSYSLRDNVFIIIPNIDGIDEVVFVPKNYFVDSDDDEEEMTDTYRYGLF